MRSMGQRIKQAREKKGLLQAQLAKLIDVKSAGVISNWENDISKPDANKIVRLCQALNISVSYLLDFTVNDEMNISMSEKEHIKKYRTLDGYGKQAVDAVLNIEHTRCSENIVVIPDTAIAARGGILAPRGPVDEEAFQRDIANLKDEDEPDL